MSKRYDLNWKAQKEILSKREKVSSLKVQELLAIAMITDEGDEMITDTDDNMITNILLIKELT